MIYKIIHKILQIVQEFKDTPKNEQTKTLVHDNICFFLHFYSVRFVS